MLDGSLSALRTIESSKKKQRKDKKEESVSERPQSSLLIFDKAKSKAVQRIYIYIYYHTSMTLLGGCRLEAC